MRWRLYGARRRSSKFGMSTDSTVDQLREDTDHVMEEGNRGVFTWVWFADLSWTPSQQIPKSTFTKGNGKSEGPCGVVGGGVSGVTNHGGGW